MLNKKKGLSKAKMTGSGSSVFKLFSDKEEVIKLSYFIKKHNPKWWVKVTRIFI